MGNNARIVLSTKVLSNKWLRTNSLIHKTNRSLIGPNCITIHHYYITTRPLIEPPHITIHHYYITIKPLVGPHYITLLYITIHHSYITIKPLSTEPPMAGSGQPMAARAADGRAPHR